MQVDHDGNYQARVARVRVRVLSNEFEYEGFIHLLAETRRIQEVLNDPKPFLNLTEAWVVDRASGAESGPHAHVALNKGCINHLFECAPTRTPPSRATPEAAAADEGELTLDSDTGSLSADFLVPEPDDLTG
ncbi:hypothetical protein L6R50_07265 [Myxococcota bacterium]|nr:hypothetical protein [Myxococcota bacterium]